MFPGVDGFRWDVGHIVFLGAFFAVLVIIGITSARAMLRSWRDRTPDAVESIRWHADFTDLPARDRHCRHEITGEVRERLCPNQFDCRACRQHPMFEAQRAPDLTAIAETGRLYHRGHTWVHPEPDGTYTVGLDEIGDWLMGKPDRIELPAIGALLKTNGTGWHVRMGSDRLRVLSPVDGEVVDVTGSEDGWYLKIQPKGTLDTTHLLRGDEARAWIAKEIERLQLALGTGELGTALADGGALTGNLEAAYPNADLDAVRGEMFLQP